MRDPTPVPTADSNPFDRGRIPHWLRSRLAADPRFSPFVDQDDLFDRVRETLDLTWAVNWDTVVVDGEERLVCRPWQLDDVELIDAVRFALKMDAELAVSGNPASRKDGPVRIVFSCR